MDDILPVLIIQLVRFVLVDLVFIDVRDTYQDHFVVVGVMSHFDIHVLIILERCGTAASATRTVDVT